MLAQALALRQKRYETRFDAAAAAMLLVCVCVYACLPGIGIETNPLYWSEQYRVYLAANVAPATLPARE